MVWPAVIAAAGSMIGGKMANTASAKQAAMNRSFQERMARSSHQYEVEDLRKAGLNPILSAGGSGAATPSGNMAPQHDVVTPATQKGIEAATAKQNLLNMKAQENLTGAQETVQAVLQQKEVANLKNIILQNKIIQSQLPGFRTEGKIDSSKYGQTLRYINRAMETLSPFSNSAKNLSFINKGN